MSGDPAIASIEQLVHAWQLRERSKRPGPPDLAGEKNHGIRTTDIRGRRQSKRASLPEARRARDRAGS